MGRNYWLLRCLDVSSAMASKMLISIISWYLVKYQNALGSAAAILSSYFFVKMLMGILISPMADKVSLRNYLNANALVQMLAVIIAVFILTKGGVESIFLFFASSLAAIPDILIPPAISASMAKIVDENRVSHALRYKFAIDSFVNVLALAIGVVSLETFGVEALYLAVSLTFISLVISFAVQLPQETARGDRGEYIRNLFEGFQRAFKYKVEAWWNLISSITNIIITPTVALITPYFVKNYANGDGWKISLLEGSLAIGIIFGATKAHSIVEKFFHNKMTVVQGTFFGLSFSLLSISLMTNVFSVLFSYFLIGVFAVINDITVESVRSLAIPEEYRGRIQSIHYICSQAAIPIGFLITGKFLSNGAIMPILLVFSIIIFTMGIVCKSIPNFEKILNTPAESLNGIYGKIN